MCDLISRSALLKKKTRMTEYDETGLGVHVIVVRADYIANAPAVDAEPVRHGEWRRYPECGVTRCSVCDWSIEECFSSNYCPNCGARMDKEEHDARKAD